MLRILVLNGRNNPMACQTVFLSKYVAMNTLQLKGSRPLLLSYLCPRQAPQGSLYQPETADNLSCAHAHHLENGETDAGIPEVLVAQLPVFKPIQVQ